MWVASQIRRSATSAPPPASPGSAPPGWTGLLLPARRSRLSPHPQAARGSLSAGAARSPPPAARRPLPTLFSLLPSLPPPPPLHLQRPAARRTQFRPTAWHPSASAVCLGLGESNQERRLQFSGRAVRGASSLLFIHQQHRADPGLALACRRPRPLRAREHPPPRLFSMRSAHPRFGCFLSCPSSPLSSSAPPLPSRRPLGLGSPALCGPRSAPGVSTFSIPGRLPGSRVTADQLMVSFPLPEALICAQPYLRVILAQRGGSRQSGRQRILSCYLPRVCVWVLILVWLSPMSRSDLRKRPREGQSGCVHLPPPPPPSLSVILPALPFGVASAPGRSHGPPPYPTPLHFPLLFSALRSTPRRPILERSGFSVAGDDRGVGRGGLAGVGQPA